MRRREWEPEDEGDGEKERERERRERLKAERLNHTITFRFLPYGNPGSVD